MSPLSRHFLKMVLTSASASVTAWAGDASPRAARAIILGSTNVPNTSLSAALAGPGWPMLVDQLSASFNNASLLAGLEPKGSVVSQLSSWGTALGKAGNV